MGGGGGGGGVGGIRQKKWMLSGFYNIFLIKRRLAG